MSQVIELKLNAVRPLDLTTRQRIRRMSYVVDVKTILEDGKALDCTTCVTGVCLRHITTVRVVVIDDISESDRHRLISTIKLALFQHLHRADRNEGSITVSYGTSQVVRRVGEQNG